MSSKTKKILVAIGAAAFIALAINLMFFDSGPTPPKFKASANVVEVTEQNFKSEVLESKVPVIIDFNATWCTPCKTYAPTFHKVADEYAGKVKFVSVDVDNAPGVAELFGVNAIPATVFLSQKDGVISGGAASGALDEATLKKLLEYCLKPDAKLIPLFELRKPGDNAKPSENTKPDDNGKPADPADPSVTPKNDTEPTIDTSPQPHPKSEPAPQIIPPSDFPRVDPLPPENVVPKAEKMVPTL